MVPPTVAIVPSLTAKLFNKYEVLDLVFSHLVNKMMTSAFSVIPTGVKHNSNIPTQENNTTIRELNITAVFKQTNSVTTRVNAKRNFRTNK